MLVAYAGSIDEPHVFSRHVPPAYRQTSPYVREFLEPLGIVDILEYFLIRTSTHHSLFALGRLESQGVVTEREISLGGLLLPHLRRSVTISKVLDARTIERNRMAEALNALKCAVVLTNRSGGILHANRAAERKLRHGDGIESVRGVLQAKAPEAARELRSAIQLAAEDETTLGKIGLAIRLDEEGAPPAFAHVLPLARGELRTRLEPEAVAAVFVGGSDEDGGAEALAAAFGLSPAETRVMESLVAGRSLKETAAELGVAITTAKTHLDNIFQKTGVHRQAELMRLAARAASPARPPKSSLVDS
jgi:DNA-binding CsgD family transcriptional regulator